MTDAEILQEYISPRGDWRYAEVRVDESIDQARRQWPRIDEARQLLAQTLRTEGSRGLERG